MFCIKIFINALLYVKLKYGLFGINAKVTKSVSYIFKLKVQAMFVFHTICAE